MPLKNYKPKEHIKKRRYHFADKGPYNQSYGFSVCRCESWTIKKAEHPRRCFQIVVLDKTLESPLDCKEIKPVKSKGNQP